MDPYHTTRPRPPQATWPPTPHHYSAAVIVEAAAAIFGVYGIGWVMSGRANPGVLLLIVGLLWDLFAFFGVLVTGGGAACCLVPIHVGLVVASTAMLALRTRE